MFNRAALFLALTFSFATMATAPSTAGSDDRALLVLNAAEATEVRSEMRKLLESVSEILSALNKKNMAAVEKAARKSGMVMVGQVEVSLKEKLTPTFMKLGKSVHVGFDQIADAARDGANQDKIINLLSEQTNRCTTCHASFGIK